MKGELDIFILFYFVFLYYVLYVWGAIIFIYGNMANGGKLLNCQICCGNNGQGRSSLTDTDRSILYTGSSSILLVIGQ